jgi:hypothetical protein
MKFTLQKSSLDIDVRAEDAGSEVSIRTKGMQWDGMEEEIERAKKMAEETAAGKPGKRRPAMISRLRCRREKKTRSGNRCDASTG